MKNYFFLLLILVSIKVNSQIIPILNGGFEETLCPLGPVTPPTCNPAAILNYFEMGCLATLRSQGWYRGTKTPGYMHSDCTPQNYNAYQGNFCALIGAPGGGDGEHSSIFYQFPAAEIKANTSYAINLNYLTVETGTSEYYFYFVGSNTIDHLDDTETLTGILAAGGTILAEKVIDVSETGLLQWNNLSAMLINNTGTNYSQLLIYATREGRSASTLEVTVAIDDVSGLTTLGEYCCVVPLITFECGSSGRSSVPDRPICAAVEFYSPCNEVMLDPSYFTFSWSLPDFGDDNCSYVGGLSEIFITPNMENVCFEDPTIQIPGLDEVSYSFTLPDNTEEYNYCTECNDLIVDFTYDVITNLCSGYLGTNPPSYRMFRFFSNVSLGNETPTLYYWTFLLADGTIINSSQLNPIFYVFLPSERNQQPCNLGPVHWISADIIHATLTVYSENGCKESYAQEIFIDLRSNSDSTHESIKGDAALIEYNGFQLISNLCQNEINLKSNDNDAMIADITVLAVSGDRLKNWGQKIFFQNEVLALDISDLSQGYYLIRITNNEYHESIPFIKL